jgi:hypothetical protein
LMDMKSPISSTFPQSFIFNFLPALLSLILISYSIWLNHHVLECPTGLFLLNFNSNALLGILLPPILFTWPNHCSLSVTENVLLWVKSHSPFSLPTVMDLLSYLIFL